MALWDALYPAPDWAAVRAQWPHSTHSVFVRTPGMRWHVQRRGDGPVAVLLHGTGASTHTWRDVLPLLAQRYSVVAIDLPGHGFSSAFETGTPTLPRVADAVRDLMTQLRVVPELWIGHSAGAAIAAQCCIDVLAAAPERRSSLRVVGCNPAWLPLNGPAQWLFPLAAWLIGHNPLAGWLAARRAAQPGAVERLLASTGSTLDEAGLNGYRYLLSQPAHVRGVLDLMAAWNLNRLSQQLPALRCPVLMQIGEADRTVPPAQAQAALACLPQAQIQRMAGLGHLAHEQAPQASVQAMLAWIDSAEGTVEGDVGLVQNAGH